MMFIYFDAFSAAATNAADFFGKLERSNVFANLGPIHFLSTLWKTFCLDWGIAFSGLRE